MRRLRGTLSLLKFPDVWSGWQKANVHSEEELKGDFASSQSPQAAARLRKALKNPGFVKLLARVKADMERAAQAPLRSIVVHYRADEPLYPSDEVMVHISVHQAIREFLVLCSRQGRIRPEHPQWPVNAEGFTSKVIRNPFYKSNEGSTSLQENRDDNRVVRLRQGGFADGSKTG